MVKQEEQIQKLMTKLNVSRAEAIDILATDKEIDRGAKLFELDPELEAGAKKARQADRKQPTERKPREKKEDSAKRELISCFAESLADLRCCVGHDVVDLEILNPEREFSFTYNGRKFKVVLSCPRSQCPLIEDTFFVHFDE